MIILLNCGLFSGCLGQESNINNKPSVEITYPQNGMIVSQNIGINGDASDPDGNNTLLSVQVKIDDGDWNAANGTTKWSYNWATNSVNDGSHNVSVRAWDGAYYSNAESIEMDVLNPRSVELNMHKWAVFIIAANFPKDNGSKLGNGGLYLAENMTEFFIENLSYSTSNIVILFDDGWIRSNNGYGQPIETLQQRPHKYNVNYGGATKQNVSATLQQVVEESNLFEDSEVFIWIFNHGYGDESKRITGDKVLQQSVVSLWDAPPFR